MAVNLTKPFQGREYTPVHLMDEEESIQRSSLTTDAPDKLPSYTPEHIAYEPDAPEQGADIDVSVVHIENVPAVVEKPDLNVYMNELLEGIENADADTREKFMNEFLKAAKMKKTSSCLFNWLSICSFCTCWFFLSYNYRINRLNPKRIRNRSNFSTIRVCKSHSSAYNIHRISWNVGIISSPYS